MLDELQNEIRNEENENEKQPISSALYNSYTAKKEENKQELFQYKIVDRDSDVDVIEGLGNTTLKDDNNSLESSDEEANDGAPFNESPPKDCIPESR